MKQKLKCIKDWIVISLQWLLIRKYIIKAAIKDCNGDKSKLLKFKNNLYLTFYKEDNWVSRRVMYLIDRELYETED